MPSSAELAVTTLSAVIGFLPFGVSGSGKGANGFFVLGEDQGAQALGLFAAILIMNGDTSGHVRLPATPKTVVVLVNDGQAIPHVDALAIVNALKWITRAWRADQGPLGIGMGEPESDGGGEYRVNQDGAARCVPARELRVDE